jgi:hypothetical protein
MTSIARETDGNSADMAGVESAVIAALASAFSLTPRDVARLLGDSAATAEVRAAH